MGHLGDHRDDPDLDLRRAGHDVPREVGGISLYANEAWRKYTTFVGPVAAFGYWIGWSVVLSIFGKIIGDLIEARWFPHTTWTVGTASST